MPLWFIVHAVFLIDVHKWIDVNLPGAVHYINFSNYLRYGSKQALTLSLNENDNKLINARGLSDWTRHEEAAAHLGR